MRTKLLMTFTAILAFFSAFSATAEDYTLEKAVQKALDNSYEMKLAKMDIEKAEAAVREAWGNALPTVNLSSNFNHFLAKPMIPFPDFGAMLNNSVYGVLFQENVIPYDKSKFKDMGTVLQSFSQANSFGAGLEVNQILFNSAVFRGIGASGMYLNISKEALRAAEMKKAAEVKKAFYGALYLQNRLQILMQSYENARSNLKNVVALSKNGIVSEFDALRAEVQVENIQPGIVELENALKNATDGLKMLMGLDPTEQIEVVGELQYANIELPSAENAVSEALNSNYDIRTYNLVKDVDKEFIELARSEYWPTVVAFGSASYNGTSDNFDFQTYNQAIVGLGFSINLFNGMKTKNKVQQSTIAYEQSVQRYEQLKDAITMAVKSNLIEIEKVKSALEARERNVKLAERAYELSRVKFKEGTATQLDILNADDALRNARVNRLQSVFDFNTAYANFQQLMGRR